jgi:hypothetical protein
VCIYYVRLRIDIRRPFTEVILLDMTTSNKVDNGAILMAEKSAIQRNKELDAERANIFDRAQEEADRPRTIDQSTR